MSDALDELDTLFVRLMETVDSLRTLRESLRRHLSGGHFALLNARHIGGGALTLSLLQRIAPAHNEDAFSTVRVEYESSGFTYEPVYGPDAGDDIPHIIDGAARRRGARSVAVAVVSPMRKHFGVSFPPPLQTCERSFRDALAVACDIATASSALTALIAKYDAALLAVSEVVTGAGGQPI